MESNQPPVEEDKQVEEEDKQEGEEPTAEELAALEEEGNVEPLPPGQELNVDALKIRMKEIN